jgi:hypothetical protein
MKLKFLNRLSILLLCTSSSLFAQPKLAELKFVSVHPTPVIGKGYKGAEDVKFGFEGGTAVKVKGTYYIFTTEIFDVPKTAAVRLGRWESKDGINFTKKGIIAQTNFNWEDTKSHEMSPWSPNAVYDEDRKLWSVFHVGYSRKPNSTNVFNMSGRIFRHDAVKKGVKGIAGPFKKGDWLDIDDKPEWWEGPGKIVCFYPYKVGKEWWGFYGGNSVPEHISANGSGNPNAKNIFYAGLAKAESGITSKWVRQPQLNPVQMNPTFVENSIVTKVAPNLYINLYDGGKIDKIAYACSSDGIHWGKEQVIIFDTLPKWVKYTRTPLSLINEGNGIYTIYFTCFDGINPEKVEPLWHAGYGSVGKLQVKLVVNK